MNEKEKESKDLNKDSKFIKRIYYLAIAILVSFWCVVLVAGVKLSSYTKTLNASQAQLESVEKTIEDLDMDTLSDTINTLNKAIKKLKPFIGK